jgi:trigger factor
MTDIKKLPKSQIEFELTVPWSEWEKHLNRAAEELSREIKISGFRPGKAPRNLVEQKIGKPAILNNASEKAIKKSYVDFIAKEKLDVIGSPKIEIKEITENKDLKFTVKVSIMPKIKIENDYKKDIKKINEEFIKKDKTIEEKDIDLEIEKLANNRVKLITVRREAKSGDSVEIDFSVSAGGKPIENGESKKHPLILGKGVFIPGFEEKIVGMKEGEEKEFELIFPDSYRKKDLAGKSATFKVKMNLVQERQTPEVDDDFAKSLGNFSDMAGLRKSVREGLRHEKEHKMKDGRKAEFIEKIIAHSKIDLPEILVEQEIKTMFHDFEHQISSLGMTIDQYFANIRKDKKELEKDWKPQAEKRIISSLALKKIARDENIAADSKEVEAEMNKTLKYYKNVKDMEKNLDMERLYNYCKEMVENEKVFEFLEKL